MTLDVHKQNTSLVLSRLKDLLVHDSSFSKPKALILYQPALANNADPIMAAAQSLGLLNGRAPTHILVNPLTSLNLAVAKIFSGDVVILKLVPRLPRSQAAGTAARVQQASLSLSSGAAGNAVLTLSATDPIALAHAARLIGHSNFAWPDKEHAVISLPPTKASARRATTAAQPESTVSFKKAGLSVETETGRSSRFSPLIFWNSNWNSHAILYLHLAYSAGAAPGSMILAYVNGKMVGTIPLTNMAGGTYPDYKLLIPENAMKVGENRLVLKTVFNVRQASAIACTAHNVGRSLAATVFSDSRLTIIGGSPVKPNNLAAIRAGAYPVDVVAVPRPSPATLSAAATFGAKIAQIDHRAGIKLVSALPEKPLHGLVIFGTNRTLSRDLIQKAGLVVGRTTTALAEPAKPSSAASPSPLKVATNLVDHVLGRPIGYLDANASVPSPKSRKVTLGNFADSVVISVDDSALPSVADNVPVIVASAGDGAILQKGIATLVDSHEWRQLSGRISVVLLGSSELETVKAPVIPWNAEARVGYLASRNPFIAIFLLGIFLILIVVIVRFLIGLRHRRLYPSVKGVDSR